MLLGNSELQVKIFAKNRVIIVGGPGNSLPKDLNHSIEDGLDNAPSNSSNINVRSITRALPHPILKL